MLCSMAAELNLLIPPNYNPGLGYLFLLGSQLISNIKKSLTGYFLYEVKLIANYKDEQKIESLTNRELLN